MNQNQIIYITGATGSMGGALAHRLSEQGFRLRLLVRDEKKVAALQALPGVELCHGDISQPQSLQGTMDGCALVFHCAAKLQGTNRDEYQRVNVEGTQALAKEAARAGVERFIHVSTIAVYGYPNQQGIGEDCDWVQNNHNPYNRTKQNAEKALLQVSETSGLKVSIARSGDVFGPGQFGWTVQMIQLLRSGMLHPPTVSTSGMANLVYIENLLDALMLLADHPTAVGQAFNIVDESISMHDYIVTLAHMAHAPAFAVPGPLLYAASALLQFLGGLGGREAKITRDNAALLLHKDTFSSKKVRSLLKWTPAVNLEEANQRTEAWLRANRLI